MSINKGQLIREALQKYDKAKQEEGADLCRECELAQKVQELEEENMSLRKAGHRLAMLMCDIVLDEKIDEQAMSCAITQWSKARAKEESK